MPQPIFESDLSHSSCDSEYDGDLAGITELRHAMLISANLSFSSFRDVDLEGSDLTGATLFKTRAQLSSFGNAVFDSTVIVDSDLAGARIRNVLTSWTQLYRPWL